MPLLNVRATPWSLVLGPWSEALKLSTSPVIVLFKLVLLSGIPGLGMDPPTGDDWIKIDNDNAIRLWRRTALKLLLILEWRKQFHQSGMALQHANIKELQLPENKKQKNKKKDTQK